MKVLILSCLISLCAAAPQSSFSFTRYAEGYAAATATGQVIYLSPGGELIGSVSVTDTPLLCAAASGTAVLTGGVNGTLYASANGADFTLVDCGVVSDLTAVAFFKGMWVVGTREGQLLVGNSEGFVMADVSFVSAVTSLAATGSQCVGVTSSGEVVSTKNGVDWKVLDFNEYYKGFYAPCSFTAVCIGDYRIAVAGVQEDGKPALYFSTNGNVWSARELNYQGPQNNYLFVEGIPHSMCYQKEKDQFVLVFDKGYVLEVPPCSHCNKWLPTFQNIF